MGKTVIEVLGPELKFRTWRFQLPALADAALATTRSMEPGVAPMPSHHSVTAFGK
ncbi:hypothetical protein D3C86_2266480 [compost metagenome]